MADEPSYPDLAREQADFIRVLQQGPAAFPEGLFAGSTGRALLGLKAHANTISHARLVALEETFPRLRERLGHARFNRLSRDYVERPEVMRRSLRSIGEGFDGFIAAGGEDLASADLARIEWAWLQSYHAAEADALALADIAALDEEALLALPVAAHPAAQILPLSAPIAPELGDMAQAGQPAALLVTRPDAEVLLRPVDTVTIAIFKNLSASATMGNLLQIAAEQGDDVNALAPVIGMMEAGALIRS